MIAVSAPLCNEAFFYGITSEMSYVLFQSLRLEEVACVVCSCNYPCEPYTASYVNPIDHTP